MNVVVYTPDTRDKLVKETCASSLRQILMRIRACSCTNLRGIASFCSVQETSARKKAHNARKFPSQVSRTSFLYKLLELALCLVHTVDNFVAVDLVARTRTRASESLVRDLTITPRSRVVWTQNCACSNCRDSCGSCASQFDAAARRGCCHLHLYHCPHSDSDHRRRVVLLRQQLRRDVDHLHTTLWQVAGTRQREGCWGGRKVWFTLPHQPLLLVSTDRWTILSVHVHPAA